MKIEKAILAVMILTATIVNFANAGLVLSVSGSGVTHTSGSNYLIDEGTVADVDVISSTGSDSGYLSVTNCPAVAAFVNLPPGAYNGTVIGSFSACDIDFSNFGGGSGTQVSADVRANGTGTQIFKVELYDGGFSLIDQLNFTIVGLPKTVTLLSPNGGETLTAGVVHSVTWSSSGSISNVKLEYSTNNGAGWTVIEASTANDGQYDWTLPEVDSNQCLVRVSDASDSGVNDVSDDVFEVVSEPIPMELVYIDDPGVAGHEAFKDYMSRYPTTNDQYCNFLNAALASGDITVGVDDLVYGANGSNPGTDYVGQMYLETYSAATGGQITYSGGTFSVLSKDGYYMNNHPVIVVSYYGAMAFCNYYGWRLPTEWEWQAVADYAGTFTYGCGTTIDHSKANYDLDNPLGLSSDPYTSPVGHYPSYGYGMNDMAGNVWDWTTTVSGNSRIVRGGSWYFNNSYCTVSYQVNGNPASAYGDVGFRVVCDTVWHVDCDGSDANDGRSRADAFATIQAGIDAATDGDTVLVWPGVYDEGCDFLGKAITVTSAGDAAVVRNASGYAFAFSNGEQSDSVLSNLVIAGGLYGIYADTGCRPSLKNLTIADNSFGISCFSNADPNIVNCILANDTGDLQGCVAEYSWVKQDLLPDAEPLFADPNNGDYHLLSERGRYRATTDEWLLDKGTSPCIDAGDPMEAPTGESDPNGGRVNQGAYGNTSSASLSEWPLAHDSNRDGRVNLADFARMAGEWLDSLPWAL